MITKDCEEADEILTENNFFIKISTCFKGKMSSWSTFSPHLCFECVHIGPRKHCSLRLWGRRVSRLLISYCYSNCYIAWVRVKGRHTSIVHASDSVAYIRESRSIYWERESLEQREGGGRRRGIIERERERSLRLASLCLWRVICTHTFITRWRGGPRGSSKESSRLK